LFCFHETQHNTPQITHSLTAAAARALFQFAIGTVSMFALLAITTLLANAIRVQALSTLAATIAINILTLFTRAAARAIRGRTFDTMTATAAHSTRALLACRDGSGELSRAVSARHC
jgi:hypothetical protein